MPKSKWIDYEQWKKYGISHGYEERSPTSLCDSRSKVERSWFYRGAGKTGWAKEFPFKREVSQRNRFKNYEQWKKYGVSHKYDESNPFGLESTDDNEAKSWYRFGLHRKWSKNFPFKNKSARGKFKNFKDWKAYGISHGYEERSPVEVRESDIKEEQQWARWGYQKKWITRFDFTYQRVKSNFREFDQWKEQGIKKGYSDLNPKSIREDKDDADKKRWYSVGARNKWLKEFPFNYKMMNKNNISSFLKNNSQASAIANLSTLNGYAAEAASYLAALWPDKFANYREIVKELPGLIPKITGALGPLDVEGIASGIFQGEIVFPLEVRRDIECLLTKIGIQQYQRSFNIDPKQTIKELDKNAKMQNNPEVKKVIKGIRNYYEGVLDFNIPGYGKLEDRI